MKKQVTEWLDWKFTSNYSSVFYDFFSESLLFKGTDMQIGKALINDRLRVLKVS